jgi:hypothetical protein
MVIGSKPIDGGYLIFDEQERSAFLESEPKASKFMRPFIGGQEYLHGEKRWILALQDASPTELHSLPMVKKRLKEVREYRRGERPARRKANTEPKTPGISARSLADRPTEFHVTVIPSAPFLAIPENSSEKREYLPIGWLKPPTIPSNKLRFIQNATLWHFGILTSRMHMTWMRHIGGRLESRYQYSITVVYNAFPWPEADERHHTRIEELAQSVLDARSEFEGASLADLYDVDTMAPVLSRAHRALDLAVEKLYRATTFTTDRERVEHLFGLYERLVMPPLAPVLPEGSGLTTRRRTRGPRP